MENQISSTDSFNSVEPSNVEFQSPSQNQNFNDSANLVPLSSHIEERKKFQKQIGEERSLRERYENILSSLGQDLDPLQFEQLKQNQENLKSEQEKLQQQMFIQTENQSTLRDIQENYKEIFLVPEVKSAIDAYLSLDVDPNMSLKEQGFQQAVEYISSIYKAGYNSGMSLKSQNDSAKARMSSSIMDSLPSSASGRVFSRSEIASMDSETFLQNEKFIFDQMARGLIK